MTDSSQPLPTDMTCTIEGCTNRRSNAGYGRYRKVCEKHHHQRYGMDYQNGRIKRGQTAQHFHAVIHELLTIGERDGWKAVQEKIEELLQEKK